MVKSETGQPWIEPDQDDKKLARATLTNSDSSSDYGLSS